MDEKKPLEEADIRELASLGDEYKILQDKIDKIGAFRVTIKGWSVTAVVAGFVAITTSKGFSPSITALGLDILLICFFWLEREQVVLGWEFNSRARNIEIQIDMLRRSGKRSLFFSTPNIARSLFSSKKKRDFLWHEFENDRLERYRLGINKQVRLLISCHIFFYLALCMAAWLPVWLKASPPPSDAQPVIIHNDIHVPPTVRLEDKPQGHIEPRNNADRKKRGPK